jgi:hypothetical protein
VNARFGSKWVSDATMTVPAHRNATLQSTVVIAPIDSIRR